MSWTEGIRRKVWYIAQKTDPSHLRRLASLLRGLAAEVEEKVDGKMTKVLSAHPFIPRDVFAAAIGVSGDVGSKLYIKWHKKTNTLIPKKHRTSLEERRKWRIFLGDWYYGE